MKIAIMQPYFFPYIGYFQLINAVDRFVLGDGVQYIYQGWINRNRILKPVHDDFIYIRIPVVKFSSDALIKDMKAVEGEDWKVKMLSQFTHYKKAPYYRTVHNFLTECFVYSERDITRLNAYYLKAVCDYIGIEFKVEIQTEMNFDYSNVTSTGTRPIRMCEQMAATEYINPIGGMQLYSKEEFSKSNIELKFMQSNITEYDQQRKCFIPGLSILDVMMFNSTNDIKQMLNNYELS